MIERSPAERFAALPEPRRKKILASLSTRERAVLEYTWEFWARPKQLEPPGDWRLWMLCAGRGYGKTRCGAEWVRHLVETGRAGRIALVAATTTMPPTYRPRVQHRGRRPSTPDLNAVN
jgi:hypothetical protein